ncbi:hypothetical protein F0562_018147 [Nyssa sinensis]|uniref:Uncharacterized protein n=1 Tax=Nyssa sinensis TaxID=561372 RepID=A0A5J4ZBJ7_9ASTE|nr:hypothetical protein F0562_018147 [Nyssa sinensis]
MAEGTRLSQLSETVNNLQGVTIALKEEQSRHGMLIEGVLQQLNNLASSYGSLVQITTNLSPGEGTSNSVKVNANPLFDGRRGIQARSLRKPKLYLLEGMEFEGEGEEELEEEETFQQPDTETIPVVQQAEMLGVSLHAIVGAPSPKTMRLVGKIGTCSVIVLIDIDSTHSFIDVNVARRAKLPVKEGHLAVQVANGDTLPCFGYCKAVLLKMQSCNILANLFLLTLGGCDVVLRVDWLRSLGTIQWNFVDLSMSFLMEGENLCLQGLRLPEKAIEEEHSLSKAALVEGRGIWLQLMEISDSPGGAPVEPAIQAVLNKFETVFAEPNGLPPLRSHDH